MEEKFLEELEGKLKEITPVESYKDILLKRDDKFILGNANGGKLRQAITLLIKNLDKIKKKHKGSVVCSCSIKSPQSGITATVCKRLGLKCNVVVYKTNGDNGNLTLAQLEGANIYGTTSGYTSVIDSYARKYFPNDFFTNMGFSAEEVIEANIRQVSNIPDDLDVLVIPVGSAMNFISILKGIISYDKNPKEIIGVAVGKDPMPSIMKYYPYSYPDFKIVQYDKPYGTWIDIDSCFFDPIYEAKAYDWIMKNIDVKKKKVMLWVVGKRNLDLKPEPINFKELNKSQRRL